jgi:hypothetical protein
MIARVGLALLGVVVALGLAGCGERPQVIEYKQGKYQGKPDEPPYSAKFNGNQNEWELAIKQRNQNQNEYKRPIERMGSRKHRYRMRSLAGGRIGVGQRRFGHRPP